MQLRELYRLLSPCGLCPRDCGADRIKGELGSCGVALRPVVASWGPHHGEESVLRGRGGSGTIFFSGCNLRCVFCQNVDISRSGAGRPVTARQLSLMMLDLERRGCHNVNLVSPTHVAAVVAAAIDLARRRGLTVPLVYNTGGYDRPDVLRFMGGRIDVYMPDMKFGKEETSRRLAAAGDYVTVNRRAVLEMHRQVGTLEIDDRGLATRGVLVRHLVLPGMLDETESVLTFLARRLGKGTAVNVMGQYYPCHHAHSYPPLDRPLSRSELTRARLMAGDLGLRLVD